MMTKKEFQDLYEFTNEEIDTLDYLKKEFNATITQIRKGSTYDEKILTKPRKLYSSKTSTFSSSGKGDIGESCEEWEILYNL